MGTPDQPAFPGTLPAAAATEESEIQGGALAILFLELHSKSEYPDFFCLTFLVRVSIHVFFFRFGVDFEPESRKYMDNEPQGHPRRGLKMEMPIWDQKGYPGRLKPPNY